MPPKVSGTFWALSRGFQDLGPLPFNSWSNSTHFWKFWPGFPLQGNTLPMESRVIKPQKTSLLICWKRIQDFKNIEHRRIERNSVEVELWWLKFRMLSFFKRKEEKQKKTKKEKKKSSYLDPCSFMVARSDLRCLVPIREWTVGSHDEYKWS